MADIKKGKAAELLGISAARLSQLIAKGLPVTRDGLIDMADALGWIKENVDPGRSAWWYHARGLEKQQLPAEMPGEDLLAPASEFSDRGHRGFALAALLALYWSPFAVVAAIAEAGGSRELAEKAGDSVMIGLWHLLDEEAGKLGMQVQAEDGAVILLNKRALTWTDRVPWNQMFGASPTA